MTETTPQKKPTLAGVDLVKLICSILVVCVHTNPLMGVFEPGNFFLVNGLGRIAVPFFFLCAGYFFALSLSRGKKNSEVLVKYLVRIVLVYAVWSILFLPLDLPRRLAGDWGTTLVNLARYGASFLFLGTHFQFWYFPALISSILLLYWVRNRLPWGVILGLGAVFYGISCLGDTYYQFSRFPPMGAAIDLWEKAFVTTRNLMFDSFLYVALGAWSASHRPLFRPKTAFILAAVFLGLYIGEAFLTEALKIAKDHNTGIFLVPAGFFLFQSVVQWDWAPKQNSKTWRDGSLVMYCSHPLLGGAGGYAGTVGLSGGIIGWIFESLGTPVSYPLQFLTVLIFSLVVSVVVVRSSWRPLKYLY